MTFSEVMALWKVEVFDAPRKKVTLRLLFKRLREKELPHFLFWYRLGQYLHRKPAGLFRYPRMAKRIRSRLHSTHGLDISMAAQIGPGFHIGHRVGVVITGKARIGRNFHIRQNTTIGLQHPEQPGMITIGDNVEVGAHSCILGNDLHIGDDVVIGAMSFVNKDIPAGSTFYTTHSPNLNTSRAPVHERPQ